mmetsp:Transcript_76076/g.211493  ORF Transcript_76076/g.211493 Transcript_76076/m.211493 type:complete len:814 (-) Transcript_76076:137-2578(-)
MSISVERLEACVNAALAVTDLDDMLRCLDPVLCVLASPKLMARSFLRGLGADSSVDYAGILAAFERLCSKNSNRWASQVAEKIRSEALLVFAERLSRAPSPPVSEVGTCISVAEPPIAAAPVGVATVSSSSSAVGGFNDEEGGSRCSSAAPPQGAVGGAGPSSSWAAAVMAALLPLMADALPRDANGICVIPHRHRMEQQEAGEDSLYFTSSGRLAFRTNKVCDNCQTRIMDRFFYHCSENCDIDFCEDCHRKLEEVFDAFFQTADNDGDEDRDRRHQRLMWVIQVTDRLAAHVLHLNAADRRKLAREFAFEWPTGMFERFIRVVTDVVNAKVVHVQDVKDIQSDEKFWYAIGLLQFLYSANALPCSTKRFDEHGARGPKIEYDNFILEGINKCEPISEWQRWREHPSAQVPDVLAIDEFRLTADFCSFLTHNNLVPVSFRRVCLLCDIWEQIQLEMGRVIPLQIEVHREPASLLQDVLASFDGLNDSQLRRPLRVTFEGEEGAGPGVTKEFFQVALRSFLDGSGLFGLFRYSEHQRTYWFHEDASQREAFRACGILLGQAVLNNVLVPNIFPRVLYEKLLHDLESPCARPVGLEDLATVSKELAQSLQRVLDYGSNDIGDVFGDLDWAATGRLPAGSSLTQENKAEYVKAYVEWFFAERIVAQFTPLSEGFRAILGGSALLRSMVDAVQLEKIVCGGSVPVDVPAIRRGAAHEGWSQDEEAEYLSSFWCVVESFSESERVQFVVFVTASDRVPLRGWQDLQLTVQKNGVGDERLPTAHTCFCQLLLPKYSTIERLRTNLLLAVANSEGFGLR